MDVDPDTDLCDFIDSLGKEEEEEVKPVQSSTAPPSSHEVKESDVWLDIEDALHRWTGRILDAETRHEKTATFRENIDASLRRQQLDGFLTHHDITELRYIANLWTDLLIFSSSYTIGCDFVKGDILTCLLELYNLRQITERLFIETCLKL